MRYNSHFSRALLVLGLVASLCPCSLAQQSAARTSNVQPRLTNLDFESGAVGQIPDGWAVQIVSQ
jgi:hypothetical protein